MMFKKVFNKIATKSLFIGTILGTSATSIYNYYNPQLVKIHSDKNSKFGYRTIKSMIEDNQPLNDAVAVLATKSATQHGKEFYNNIDDEGRRSIIAHPYDKQGTGVSVTVIYFDEIEKDYKIMLMQKLKSRNKPELGLKEEYDAIGGYTKGAGVEGSDNTDSNFEQEENRDFIEDNYLENGQYQNLKSKTSLDKRFVDKEYQQKITETIGEYFKDKLKEDPYVRQLNPIEVKAYLKSKNINYTRDYNQIETGLREFIEETGFNGIISLQMIEQLYSIDNYAVNNVANLHTAGPAILINLGALKKAPIIYDSEFKGNRESNSFIANNTEIGRLLWVAVDDVKNDESNLLHYNNIPIKTWYVPVLNNIIKHASDKDLEKISNGKIVNRQNIESWQKLVHDDIFPKRKINSEFDKDGKSLRQFYRCFAQEINKRGIINNEVVMETNQQCGFCTSR